MKPEAGMRRVWEFGIGLKGSCILRDKVELHSGYFGSLAAEALGIRAFYRLLTSPDLDQSRRKCYTSLVLPRSGYFASAPG